MWLPLTGGGESKRGENGVQMRPGVTNGGKTDPPTPKKK